MNIISEVHGLRVLTYQPDGKTLASESDAVELIGAAFNEHASVVVVPADRVADEFYTLSTRVAGDVVRKFAGYRIRLVIVGDITERLAASDTFRAFVHEINRGKDIWFLPTEAALTERLTA